MHFFNTPKRIMRAVLALIICSLTSLSVYAMPAPDYSATTALPQCASITPVNANVLPSQLDWGTKLELSFTTPSQAVASSDLLVYEVDTSGTPIANSVTHRIPALTEPAGYGAFDTSGAPPSQTTAFALMFVYQDPAGNAVCRSDVSLTQFQGVATAVLGVQVDANGTEICSTIDQTFATSATNPEFRMAGEAVEVSFSNGNAASQAGRLIVQDVNTNEQFTVPTTINGGNGITNIVSNGFPGQQNRTIEVFFEHTTADGGAVVCRSNSRFINFSAPQTENFSAAAPAETTSNASGPSEEASVENCKQVFYLDGSDAFASIPAGATHVSGNDITGSSCDDTIYGNGEDNVLDGLGGDDTIFGFDGNDTIEGGAGDDQLFGGAAPCPEDDATCVESSNTGNDSIHGDAGDDTIYGGNEDCQETGAGACNGHLIGDTIEGGTGADTIYGGNETCETDGRDKSCRNVTVGDTIHGQDGDDVISGGNEQCGRNGADSCDNNSHIGDTITSGAGADMVSGGNERCFANEEYSCDTNTHIGDTIDTGDGDDTNVFGGNESCDRNDLSCSNNTHIGDVIDTGAGNDTNIVGGNEDCRRNNAAENAVTCSGNVHIGDKIDAGEGNDTVFGGNERCDNFGSNGGAFDCNDVRRGDIITDTAPNDTDTIDAGGGNDRVNVADGDTEDTVTNAENVTSDTPGDGDNTNE